MRGHFARRDHGEPADQAHPGEQLEQGNAAENDRKLRARDLAHDDRAPAGSLSARPSARSDSPRSLDQTWAVSLPNVSSATIADEREAGQPVSISSMKRPRRCGRGGGGWPPALPPGRRAGGGRGPPQPVSISSMKRPGRADMTPTRS